MDSLAVIYSGAALPNGCPEVICRVNRELNLFPEEQISFLAERSEKGASGTTFTPYTAYTSYQVVTPVLLGSPDCGSGSESYRCDSFGKF